MAENSKDCRICDLRHLTNPSTAWCSECDQALCDECKEYHRVFRGTHNHETIGIDDYLSLTQSVNVYTSHCSTHNDKYQMYCQTHDIPLCLFCVEEHGECKNVIHLSKKTKEIKTSDSWMETEQTLVDIAENIDKMETEAKKNVEDFGEQKESILANISRVRQEINDHLDKLEESFRNEVTKIKEQSTRNMKDTLQMLDETKSERLKYQQQLQEMKKHASDLQTYFGLHQISPDIVELESSLQSVIEKGSLDKISLTCSINESLNDITKRMQTFETIAEKKIPSNITYIKQKDKQAQIVGVILKSIDDIKVKLIQKFSIDSNNIKGCDIFPDKKMVFSDYTSHGVLFITDTNGKQPFKLQIVPPDAFDVACIDNNTLAVTSGLSNKGIHIVDIESKTITYNIHTENLCHGITYSGGLLFYCVKSKGIFSLNPKDSSVKHIVECKLSDWSYISSFNDKLYYTQNNKSTVTCCDTDGKRNWTFMDQSILGKPLGLTVDNEGNIYIVSRQYNSVILLSPDGQQYRTLLFEHTSELNKPCVLKFDKDRNQMLIANEWNTAFLFDIYR